MTSAITPAATARRALFEEFLARHPGEAARLVDDLPPADGFACLKAAPPAVAAGVLLQLNPDTASHILRLMDQDFFAGMVQQLEPERAAGLLRRLSPEDLSARWAWLPPEMAREIQEILSFPPGSAGAIMDMHPACFRHGDTAGSALQHLRRAGGRRIHDVFLLDEDGVLLSAIPLQELACAAPERPLESLAHGDPLCVHAVAPKEEVLRLIEGRKLDSLPVVDTRRRLLGVVRYEAVAAAAHQGAVEDVQAIFGASRDERALSGASFAVRRRMPWLQINLFTAFLAAIIVGCFEDLIARVPALAVFLTVVVSQACNAGQQALAVALRGLALYEIRPRHWPALVRKELTTGLANGFAVALAAGLIVVFWAHSLPLALVCAAAIVLSTVAAGIIGALTPLLLKTLGFDPAQSSSIILTTLTDIAAFLSFLGLAALFASAITSAAG